MKFEKINTAPVPQRTDWDDMEEMGIEETNVFEDLDIKKLTSSDDFAEELETFTTRISAEVSALRATVETKSKISQDGVTPESFARLDGIISKMEESCAELASVVSSSGLAGQAVEDEESAAAPSESGKAFKKY